jgi:hypothetical protein
VTTYFVGTLSRYVLVDAEDETHGRELGYPALHELYAELRERLGKDVPINILIIRPATEMAFYRIDARSVTQTRSPAGLCVKCDDVLARGACYTVCPSISRRAYGTCVPRQTRRVEPRGGRSTRATYSTIRINLKVAISVHSRDAAEASRTSCAPDSSAIRPDYEATRIYILIEDRQVAGIASVSSVSSVSAIPSVAAISSVPTWSAATTSSNPTVTSYAAVSAVPTASAVSRLIDNFVITGYFTDSNRIRPCRTPLSSAPTIRAVGGITAGVTVGSPRSLKDHSAYGCNPTRTITAVGAISSIRSW